MFTWDRLMLNSLSSGKLARTSHVFVSGCDFWSEKLVTVLPEKPKSPLADESPAVYRM